MPSKKREIARFIGESPVWLHGHGVIRRGEVTTAISVEEARRRADFEVVARADVPQDEPAVEPADEKE